jgi:hypothetical protein
MAIMLYNLNEPIRNEWKQYEYVVYAIKSIFLTNDDGYESLKH